MSAIFQPELSKAAASITGSFTSVGTLVDDAFLFVFRNHTNNTVQVSTNGTDVHFTLVAGEAFTMDSRTNEIHLAKNIVVSVRHAGAAPTTGSFRVSYLTRLQ